MRLHSADISVSSSKHMEILNITQRVSRIVQESGIENGLVNLWVPHTTAAITVNEHDPDLWEDILKAVERLAPADAAYRHNAKYAQSTREQNARAHILNCLLKSGVAIPLEDGRALLGTWQSVLLVEMDGPRTRSIHVQVLGE